MNKDEKIKELKELRDALVKFECEGVSCKECPFCDDDGCPIEYD